MIRSPFVVVSVWLAVAAVAAPTAVRAAGWDGDQVAAPIALLPLVLPVAVVVLAVALLARQWPAAVLAALLLAAQVAWLAPRAVAEPAPAAGGRRLRVMAVNLLHGQADPAALVAAVKARRPDLLAASELTPRAAEALDRAGLAALLPYRAIHPDGGAAGTGLYARLPLRGASADGGGPMSFASPVASVGLGSEVVTVRAVHAQPPVADPTSWRRDLDLLRAAVAERPGPLVVMGDFNATADHARFRAILAAGVRDAHDARGRGLAGTWPVGRAYPPLVAIDHVLVSHELAVVAADAWRLPGSDHMAIAADLALRVPDVP
jgi:endonuclease/exonuclease/phosphatase (EEP) superfamily protein YafD